MPSRPTSLRIASDPAIADLVEMGKLRPSVPVDVAAAMLSMDESWVRKRLGRELAGHRAGRAVRVYVDSIRAYQERNPIGEPGKAAPRRKAQPKPRVEHAAHREAIAALALAGVLPQDGGGRARRGRG